MQGASIAGKSRKNSKGSFIEALIAIKYILPWNH